MGREREGVRWGGEGKGGEGRGWEGRRGEGKGKVVPPNVRDALTPLPPSILHLPIKPTVDVKSGTINMPLKVGLGWVNSRKKSQFVLDSTELKILTVE